MSRKRASLLHEKTIKGTALVDLGARRDAEIDKSPRAVQSV